MRGNVELEEGFHTLFDFQRKKIRDSWMEHAEPASHWNGAVAERISRYSPPAVLVDGLTNEYNGTMTHNDKLFVLSVLPAMPEKLNGTDEITVIAGDLTDGHPNPVIITNAALIMSNGLLVTYGGMYIGDKTGQELDRRHFEKHMVDSQGISRREFLGTFIGASAALAFSSVGITSFFNNESAHRMAKAGEELMEPFSYHQKLSGMESFSQGRTALLLEKAIHISETKYDGAELPAVMGTAHSYKSYDFIRNKELRFEMIGRLVDSAVAATSETRRQVLTDKAAKYQIIKVKTPDQILLAENPYQAVNEAVQHDGVEFHHELYSYLKSRE